jgi:signal transduction histidine kinase
VVLFQQRFTSKGASWSWPSNIWLAAAVGCGYFLAARLSLGLLMEPDGVAVFWPAAGISSGILIALGPQVRLPVAVAVLGATVAANLMGDRDVAAAISFALCNAGEAVVTAAIIQYYFGTNFNLDRPQQVFGLVAAAVVGTAFSSTLATVAYKQFHSPDSPIVTIWRHWFASDAVGIIAVAPVVVGIRVATHKLMRRHDLIESAVALVLLGAMTGIIISLPNEPWETLVPGALLFPILLWVAARSEPVFAAAGAFIASLTIVWATIFGLGHFGDTALPIDVRIIQAQVVILVITLGATMLAALFAERRQHELVLTQSEAHLAHANRLLERERDNKLMNLGAAISAISHELRQPLTAIVTKGSAARRFLERTPAEIARVQGILAEMVNASFRANEVLESVHSLFGRNDQEPHPTDMNGVIEEALTLLRGELQRHRVTVVTDLSMDLPAVLGHRGQLQEVVFNLVQNSIDAMEVVTEKGRLLQVQSERRGKSSIAVSIQDSGKGIDSEIIDNVFDAFVTTKTKGKGLGLAISKMIIERHSGQLSVSSNGTNGALFQIVLPTNLERQRVSEVA